MSQIFGKKKNIYYFLFYKNPLSTLKHENSNYSDMASVKMWANLTVKLKLKSQFRIKINICKHCMMNGNMQLLNENSQEISLNISYVFPLPL